MLIILDDGILREDKVASTIDLINSANSVPKIKKIKATISLGIKLNKFTTSSEMACIFSISEAITKNRTRMR